MINYLKEITDLEPYIGTEPFCGIRVNPNRISKEQFLKIAPFECTPCKFWDMGFTIASEDKTGLDPLHFAGAYYIQEPSAMSAITALDIKPEDKVLDLCAAPGSKATAIAPYCKLLVANEINPSRAQVLVSNIERMGISNALILNTDSANLPTCFAGYFDKVLVDSPCSGEGMFRKHPDILKNWTKDLVDMCAKRSREVIENASYCLKEGGRLVYSTCTYNLEENEKLIIDFLENHKEFELADTGIGYGHKGFLGLDKATRIFIEDGGEGHFVCALKKASCKEISYPKPFKLKYKFDFLKGITELPPAFTKEGDYGVFEHMGTSYAVPSDMPVPKGIHILRAGVKLGSLSGKVWKPDHHLFMAVKPECIINKQQVENPEKFLKGEEIECDPSLKGFTAVTYKSMVLGFGKASGGRLKNHFPKGLRI